MEQLQQAMLSYERLSDSPKTIRRTARSDKCHLNEKFSQLNSRIYASHVTDSTTLNLSDVSFNTKNHRFTSINRKWFWEKYHT